MNTVFLSALALVSAVVPSFSATHAQQVATTGPVPLATGRASDGTNGMSRESALAHPVTVAFAKTPLGDALREVARQADVRISYPSPLVAGKVVTYTGTNVTSADAFSALLRDTGLRVVFSGGQLVVVTATVQVQGEGTVTGLVVDTKTGKGVPGVHISLDKESRGVVTGDDGRYRIAGIAAGSHILTARHIGYARATKSVTVSEGTAVTVDVKLEPSTNTLEQVVVTGTVVATERKAIPTPITVLTAKDIEQRGITRIDQLFRGEVPGVLAIDNGTSVYGDLLGESTKSSVYTRGTASLSGQENPLKTYIDGVELLDPSYLGTIDPQTIERIEIITGPQAATIYGSGAMGGVMQIFTKRGSGRTVPDVTLNAKYGMLQNSISTSYTPTHDYSLNAMGGTGPEFSYAAALSYQYTGQWQPALFTRAYGGSLGATLTRGPIVVSGIFSLRSSANGTLGYGGAAPCGSYRCYFSPLLRENLESGEFTTSSYISVAQTLSKRVANSLGQTAALNIDYRVTPIWQHHLTVGRNQTDMAMTPSAPTYMQDYDSLYQINTSSGQRTTANYNTTFTPQLGPIASSLTMGGNGSWGDETTIEGCAISKDATTYNNCYSTDGPRVNKSPFGDSWGGFGSWQVALFDRVFVTFGLRGERNQSYGRDRSINWTPTNGITYTVEYGQLTAKLLASYGSATKPPLGSYRNELAYFNSYYEPSRVVYQLASLTLSPEISHGPQGGIELYYGNLGSFTINHYQQTVDDLIQSVRVDSLPYHIVSTGEIEYLGRSRYINTAKIRQKGWDATGSLNVGALVLKGTYSWSDSRVLALNPNSGAYDDPYQRKPGQAFNYLPTHTANLVASYARGGTSITTITNYIGSSIQFAANSSLELFETFYSRMPQYTSRAVTTFPAEVTKTGYVKTDLLVSQRLTSWATATVNVQNAGNVFDSDLGALFPTIGRKTLLGVSIRRP